MIIINEDTAKTRFPVHKIQRLPGSLTTFEGIPYAQP